MTLVRTGTGKITVQQNPPPGGLWASLTNFDIDGYSLKAEHRQFLDDQVAPRLVQQNAHVWLEGSASHSGSASHNLGLSRKRVDTVVSYLNSKGITSTQMQADALGALATSGNNENQLDRAVGVFLAPVANVVIPPPRQVPKMPATLTTTQFKIRMLGGLSIGKVIAQADNLYFQIWDTTNNLTCFYIYMGAGIARSIGLPLSATMSGPWNNFITSGPVQVTDFAGSTMFVSAGAGPLTSNRIIMKGLPGAITTVPATLPIDTGFTFGFGWSTTDGTMKAVDKTPWPYTGN